MVIVFLPDYVRGTPVNRDDGRLVTIPCSRDEHDLCSGSYRAGATFRASCWCECHHLGGAALTGHLGEEAA